MSDSKKSGKNAKIGRNLVKCAAYKTRESAGKTAKVRRVTRSLQRGIFQRGWFLNSRGFAQRENK